MNIKLYILNASGSLNKFTEKIEDLFPKVVENILNVLPVDNVDVIVWDNPEWAIEEYGIGGHTLTPYRIAVSIDPLNKNIEKFFTKRFEATMLHEFHHVAREQVLGNEPASRLEQSIREGLAEHFEIELTGKKPEVWDTALSKEELNKFIKIANTNKSTEDYFVYDWLFGNKELEIPKWTGYSVGFYLVEEYLKNHSKDKPSTLFNKNAEEFII